MSNNNRLVVSYSPHEKGESDVEKIMWGVVIALVPAFAASVIFYVPPGGGFDLDILY